MTPIDPNTLLMCAVISGNFSVVGENHLATLKKAGKQYVIVQFPQSPESNFATIMGSGSAFDKAFGNVLNAVSGGCTPLQRQERNIPSTSLANSVFLRLHQEGVNRDAVEYENRAAALKQSTDLVEQKLQQQAQTAINLRKEKEAAELAAANKLLQADKEQAQREADAYEQHVLYNREAWLLFLERMKSTGKPPKEAIKEVEIIESAASFDSFVDGIKE